MEINPIQIDKLPAGVYVIGDPCYFIKGEDWAECLDDTWYFGLFPTATCAGHEYAPKDKRFGMYNWRGMNIGASATMYGDGCYFDSNDREYGVDAGMIGAVPLEYAKHLLPMEEIERLGHIVEFKSEFAISYDDGVIRFGNKIAIDTDPDEDCMYGDEEWEEL